MRTLKHAAYVGLVAVGLIITGCGNQDPAVSQVKSQPNPVSESDSTPAPDDSPSFAKAAPIERAEAEYLRMLREEDLPERLDAPKQDWRLIERGYLVCARLDDGDKVQQVLMDAMAQPQTEMQVSMAVLVSATTTLCPEYEDEVMSID